VTVYQAIRKAFSLLSRRDRRLLVATTLIQMSTSLLDLVGVFLIGLVAALAVTTVQSEPPPGVVTNVADFVGLGDWSDQGIVGALALAAAVVLLSKSIFSSLLTRRVLIFLANRQALVSARLSAALLSKPLVFVQRRSSQETAFALIAGAGAATVTILGQFSIAATELALLAVLGVSLLFVSPVAAISSILFFSLVGLALQKVLGGWSARLGQQGARTDIMSLNAVQEALGAYREMTVTNRRAEYVKRIQDVRWQAAKISADNSFLAMIPKYLFEAALVVAGFLLAAWLFATQDSVAAVGTLALFIAAGSRVMPSLIRLQGASLSLRGAAGVAIPTFELADDLQNPTDIPDKTESAEQIRARFRSGFPGFRPEVSLVRVSLTYPGAERPALDDVSIELQAGKSLGIVGPSGAGKSTLADVILGVLEPERGDVALSGLTPHQAIARWPGAVAYVPQTVLLANDTVRANVALGLPADAIDDDLVWEALSRAHLAEYLKDSREGLWTHVGEGGLKLSGGQRQRLGIARALYSRPLLLVLDEATSALDAETESGISRMIAELEGAVTTIVIAHRLSTVRNVDLLVYLEQGRVAASGSFNQVRSMVPALDHQAKLMGL
jgi:ABC-type multidrug transport system fused ATPase/permease subunit